ncbi:MAG: hypothetical protein GYB33_21305 [Gammaproteobacteria bacterium]|uniref:hypothetical protein n=1 Tax=Pseudomaricurvus alcaniphilus TaxID=1166482 RepID=UPI00140BC2B1|nr:hypothetical protein [Pseudomaricurvus alcaniphilus]MBR9912887.1 hypothetical protein [Gammaproteobacteria bacterium]NHN38656.1 hypothetical protein [Pseudomaricurvus alcaniphilus]
MWQNTRYYGGRTVRWISLWLLLGTGLLGCSGDDPNLPEVLSSSAQGEHLLLHSDPRGPWQPGFVAVSSIKREQVLQSLGVLQAKYKQLRPELRVWAQPGLPSRTRVARQLAEVLGQNNLGRWLDSAEPPALAGELEGAVILRCAEADREIARQLLGALSPYLTGRVYLTFTESTAAHEMELYLLGTPYFDEQGLVTFDPPQQL